MADEKCYEELLNVIKDKTDTKSALAAVDSYLEGIVYDIADNYRDDEDGWYPHFPELVSWRWAQVAITYWINEYIPDAPPINSIAYMSIKEIAEMSGEYIYINDNIIVKASNCGKSPYSKGEPLYTYSQMHNPESVAALAVHGTGQEALYQGLKEYVDKYEFPEERRQALATRANELAVKVQDDALAMADLRWATAAIKVYISGNSYDSPEWWLTTAVDAPTYKEFIREYCPGWVYDDGHICGAHFKTNPGKSIYAKGGPMYEYIAKYSPSLLDTMEWHDKDYRLWYDTFIEKLERVEDDYEKALSNVNEYYRWHSLYLGAKRDIGCGDRIGDKITHLELAYHNAIWHVRACYPHDLQENILPSIDIDFDKIVAGSPDWVRAGSSIINSADPRKSPYDKGGPIYNCYAVFGDVVDLEILLARARLQEQIFVHTMLAVQYYTDRKKAKDNIPDYRRYSKSEDEISAYARKCRTEDDNWAYNAVKRWIELNIPENK